MDIRRSCELKDINWSALPQIIALLKNEGIEYTSCTVDIDNYPDTLTYYELDEASRIAEGIKPRTFSIHIYGELESKDSVSLDITRLTNIHGDEVLYVAARGLKSIDQLDQIMKFLGLKSRGVSPALENLDMTAFVAHRFNATGVECADKVARFLELIGFEVMTGRAYSPQSVASKVRGRIEKQEIVIAIITSGDDNTWLTQESILSEVKGKPLIVLKENSASYKSGILADYEYIPFDHPHVEAGFVPMLEGLREIGYFK